MSGPQAPAPEASRSHREGTSSEFVSSFSWPGDSALLVQE